jgi:hypothetical protein
MVEIKNGHTISVGVAYEDERGPTGFTIAPGDLPSLHVALLQCQTLGDPEHAHSVADSLLLQYIGNPDISAAFRAIKKWYA